jgi:hypothetical protein
MMNKPEQVLIDALNHPDWEGLSCECGHYEEGEHICLKCFRESALKQYAKQKREWPDKETVIKAAELEFQSIGSPQIQDMAVHGFRSGVEWVKSYISTQGKSEADRKVVRVLEYCKPHINQMWAATIVGILLDCDFMDAHSALNTQGESEESK